MTQQPLTAVPRVLLLRCLGRTWVGSILYCLLVQDVGSVQSTGWLVRQTATAQLMLPVLRGCRLVRGVPPSSCTMSGFAQLGSY